MIQKLIVGAPFGNYIDFPKATSTLGTFTAKYRGGFWTRVWRVLTTVRYYPGIQAWKNKLRLPNPGVKWLKHKEYPANIISVMGFNQEDWQACIYQAWLCKPLAIELNISCPNCPGEDKTDYQNVFKVIKRIASGTSMVGGTNVELIVKLPPVGYESRVEAAVEAGITSFHACNTLPTPNGGLSGKPLKLLSLACVKYLTKISEIKRVIGGGGITHMEDVREYLNAGCTNISTASVLFNVLNHHRIKRIAEELSVLSKV